jgi:hypothetical protein
MNRQRVQMRSATRSRGGCSEAFTRRVLALRSHDLDVNGETGDGVLLVIQKLRAFVDDDRAFQAWRCRFDGAAMRDGME